MLLAAMLMITIVLVGCKKKDEPALPSTPEATTMEDMTNKAAATVEDAKKTAETMAASMEQTTCPVMDGSKINKDIFVEYNGVKVYFCCEGCKAKFEADPEKYTANLPQFKK
jgi:YHS domain-containing protein